MSYFDPETWRAFTREEMLEYLGRVKKKASKMKEGIKENTREPRTPIMIFQQLLSPLDVYCYLKARFGDPNGFQTFLKNDDSDNMFHWDYNIKAGDKNLYFVGATQEVHVHVEYAITDPQWIEFANKIKSDFRRVGKEKKDILNSLEKWNILPNHFFETASECSEYYEDIKRSLKVLQGISLPKFQNGYDTDYQKVINKQAEKFHLIKSACIKLNILMPVMFESFLGLLIAFLIKPEVRKNKRMYESFVRSPLDVKIYDLSTRCRYFAKSIEPENVEMARYWKIVNRRNDLIHGNVDVDRDAVDTVYFDRKTPLFRSGGDRIQAHWQSVIRTHNPEQVLSDYEATHSFIYEIIGHLHPSMQEQVKMLISEREPGWDAKRGIFGKLFPSQVMTVTMEGIRYDSELSMPEIIAG